MNRRIFSLLVCLCMVLTMLPVLPAAAADQLASYYGTNEVGNGVKTTITVDGDISDWSSAMLVA